MTRFLPHVRNTSDMYVDIGIVHLVQCYNIFLNTVNNCAKVWDDEGHSLHTITDHNSSVKVTLLTRIIAFISTE